MSTDTSGPLIGLTIGLLIFVGLPLLGWWQRRRRPKQAPPPEQIEAEWGRDYQGQGKPGEPFFAVGGVGVLVGVAATFLLAWWLRGFIVPIADWLFPGGKSPR